MKDLATRLDTLIRHREAREASQDELALLRETQIRVAALEAIVTTIHIYSRRYCDGRSTYAPQTTTSPPTARWSWA